MIKTALNNNQTCLTVFVGVSTRVHADVTAHGRYFFYHMKSEMAKLFPFENIKFFYYLKYDVTFANVRNFTKVYKQD
jgi:hypothetical protein